MSHTVCDKIAKNTLACEYQQFKYIDASVSQQLAVT